MEVFINSKSSNIKTETDCLDELMDTSEAPLDPYFEEGEIQSSDEEDLKTKRSTISSIFNRHSKDNILDDGSVGLADLFENNEEMKKLKRSKRFGFPLQENTPENKNNEITQLYKDLGIDKENERHYRFNAIHLRGTQNMSTDDVLDYFESYCPLNIEWVNDVSCNVVWSDDISAAKALLGLSKRIKNLDKIHLNGDPFQKDLSKQSEIIAQDNDISEGVDARQINTVIPPGYWRLGVPDPKSPFPLLRYATRSDKKLKYAEKSSDYYKKYEGPHYGNMPGLISQSLRNEIKQSRFNNSWKNSVQDNYSIKSNPWSDLAYEWGKTDKVERVNYPNPVSVKSRINFTSTLDVPDLRFSLQNRLEKRKRYHVKVDYHPDKIDIQDGYDARTKIPRMKMYADEEEKKQGRTNTDSSDKINPVEDLRSKINRKKSRERFNLRVERVPHVEEPPSSETDNSEDEYDNEGSETWALENYQDLRESLRQNKRYHSRRLEMDRYNNEQSESDEDKDSEKFYIRDMRQRSPLQIEIDNDEYHPKI